LIHRTGIRYGLLALSCGAIFGVTPALADTTIDTTPSWNGSSAVQPWGTVAGGNTPTYGQVITTPADHFLTSFSFELNTPAGIGYTGDVYAWNGVSATGPALFQSPQELTSGPSGAFKLTTVDVPFLDLTAGSQYVLFLTTVGQSAGGNSGGPWGQPQFQNVYPGGGFVFNNGGTVGSLTSGSWNQGFLGSGSDLAFKATFASSPVAATPEFGSVFSLGGLLAASGAGLWIKRRRRKQA